MPATAGDEELSGLVGFASRVIDALGEWGVGVLTLIETVFPPIPSEVILPLSGFLAQRGDLSLWLVWTTSTAGAWAGALILYGLARRFGRDRTIAALSKLPLVDRRDFERAIGWFERHGKRSVFFARLIPGARSLVSIPAGAASMPVWSFSLLTIAGSAIWNGILIWAGVALGTQYELVDRYSTVLDVAVIGVLAGAIAWLVVRRVRRGRA
jgi:membrane protein DedA with SNARE-associated domain